MHTGRNVRQRVQRHRLRADDAGTGQDDPRGGAGPAKLAKSDFDAPFGTATGSGVIFGATGGVMEAALRTVLELVTGEKVEKFFDHADIIPLRGFEGVRYAEVPVTKVGPVPGLLQHLFPDWDWLLGATLKVGVCHGTANAKKVMEDIRAGGRFSQCHFIEFMACPGGCLGAAGSPPPPARPSGPPGSGRFIPRITPTPCGNRTRTRPFWRFTRSSSRWPLRPQEPRTAAHVVHAEREVYRMTPTPPAA